jgi:hypothetical protein
LGTTVTGMTFLGTLGGFFALLRFCRLPV